MKTIAVFLIATFAVVAQQMSPGDRERHIKTALAKETEAAALDLQHTASRIEIHLAIAAGGAMFPDRQAETFDGLWKNASARHRTVIASIVDKMHARGINDAAANDYTAGKEPTSLAELRSIVASIRNMRDRFIAAQK